jgi:molybdopterin-containing oxidoreductase family membrane subunit
LLPARLLYGQLDDLITRQHVDKMAKIILLTGSIVGYAYLTELFVAWYSANKFEAFTFFNARLGLEGKGYYAWAYYCMMFCNVVAPQIFWWKPARTNYVIVFIVCMFVNIGMWFERFVIIVTSLARISSLALGGITHRRGSRFGPSSGRLGFSSPCSSSSCASCR